jgi:hypothetical protein
MAPNPHRDNSDARAAEALQDDLARQAAAGTSGVTSVAFDGVATQTDPAEARKALLFFERRAARKSGLRPRVSTIDLSRAW